MNNLILRTTTGILFVAVLVGCIVYSPMTFGALFLVITVLATWEFCTIVNEQEDVEVNRLITTLASACLFAAFFAYSCGYAQAGLIMPAAVFMPYIITLVYLFVSQLYLDRQHSLKTWGFTMMSQLYVALPLAMLCGVSFMPYPYAPMGTVYVWMYPLAVFIFLWSSDTGAYCVGSLLGKKIPYRLFPSISPNKSWVGSIGGGLVAIAASLIIAHFEPSLTLIQWIGFAIVVTIFGTWGDLVESMIKRQLGIKDSGNILPGHGGMLDRFDSSLLAIPAALVYVYMIWMM